MPQNTEGGSFWRSAPGILTAVAGVVTALAGLVAALAQAGVLSPDRSGAVGSEQVPGVAAEALRDSTANVGPVQDISGRWKATVTYNWGDTYTETFDFRVDGARVLGTADYLGYARALTEPKLSGNRLEFFIDLEQIFDSETTSYRNHYYGVITERGIQFTLYDSRGGEPVEFTMLRE